jgi:sulfate transport system permease protein
VATSFRSRSVLPGFGLALGYTLTYLSLIVLAPLAALALRGARLPLGELTGVFADERSRAAVRLSFTSALMAALIALVAGGVVAWVLARYRFPGRRVLDAVVDLPFALPTAVAGIALASVFDATGWLGGPLAALGLQVAYTQAGIVVALVFIGLPFVVRSLQPVIEELDVEVEEAAATLGASRLQTLLRVVVPTLLPAGVTGFALALARAVGEYGSVIFIAGNLPFQTEIAPLLIIIRLEEFDYPGAMALALVMLGISFALLLGVNLVQAWTRRRFGRG